MAPTTVVASTHSWTEETRGTKSDYNRARAPVRSFVRSNSLWMMVIIKPIARNTVGPGGLQAAAVIAQTGHCCVVAQGGSDDDKEL